MTYQTILLTHDGSELADVAIPHAIDVARAMGARVLALHVVERIGDVIMHVTPAGEWMASSPNMVEIAEQVVAEERASASSQMEHVTAALRAGGVSAVRTAIVAGPAGPTIVEVAKREGADLIVIATHGRSGLGRALLGSVADHVVRNAPCAVLLCRAQ